MTMATAKPAIPERWAVGGHRFWRTIAEELYAAEAALAEAQRERDEIRSKFFNSCFDDSKTIRLLREQVTQQAATISTLTDALKRIVSDFECDYVLDGIVVDAPPKVWVTGYNIARAALASLPKEPAPPK